MKLKSIRFITLFVFLFMLVANVSLEARHHSKRKTTYIQNTYVTTMQPQPVYVVENHYVAPYVQRVVYQQPVYQPVIQERVIIKERSSPAAAFTSFAIGLGLGLFAR